MGEEVEKGREGCNEMNLMEQRFFSSILHP